MSVALKNSIRGSLLKSLEQTNAQEKVVELAKIKVIDLVAKVVEEQVPIPLPIDVRQTLEDATNGIPPVLNTENPEEYITPEVEEALNELDQDTKDNIVDTLESTENDLQSALVPITQVRAALIPVKDTIKSLNKTAGTVQKSINGLSALVNTITKIPIPTSTGAPGVPGVPLSVPNTFADTIDTVKTNIDSAKGAVGYIPNTTEYLTQQINGVELQLQSAESLVDPAFSILTILIAIFKFEKDITPTQKDELLNETRDNINSILGGIGDDANPLINEETEEDLSSRLNESSTNPLFYRGYKLSIEGNVDNPLSYVQRRIVGKNVSSNVSPNIVKGDFSYSSSLEVLIKEIQFLIDSIIEIRENNNLEGNSSDIQRLNQSIIDLNPSLKDQFIDEDLKTPITPQTEADSQQQLDDLLKEI
jgi:hypothetical protein